jgi:hypothetical protein
VNFDTPWITKGQATSRALKNHVDLYMGFGTWGLKDCVFVAPYFPKCDNFNLSRVTPPGKVYSNRNKIEGFLVKEFRQVWPGDLEKITDDICIIVWKQF